MHFSEFNGLHCGGTVQAKPACSSVDASREGGARASVMLAGNGSA
jgi:hypothetical protein